MYQCIIGNIVRVLGVVERLDFPPSLAGIVRLVVTEVRYVAVVAGTGGR